MYLALRESTNTPMKLIYDVDGTLTPSRGVIDKSFLGEMLGIAETYDVALVTGSDHDKTVEQVGKELCDKVVIYNCNGNDVWKYGKNTFTRKFKLKEAPWQYLESRLMSSQWRVYTGKHFEERPGLLNFSIVGRNANQNQRELYVQHDIKTKERENIVETFNKYFKEKYRIEAAVAGETGIDIFPVGSDKSQILTNYDMLDTIAFFGDKIEEHGNDLSIATELEENYMNSRTFHVKDWRETWQITKNLISDSQL